MSERPQIPLELSTDTRDALEASVQRLERASDNDDVEQVLGAAKDLVEAVCKVVLEERSVSYGAAEPMRKLATRAMETLDAHPKTHQDRPSLQGLSGALLQIPQYLAELRNTDGTGHGRVSVTDLHAENAELVRAVAMAWTRWVLGALGRVLADMERIDEAIRDIRQEVFRRGDLADLLKELNLEHLEREHQHRAGLAVARRWASSGTFVARWDVVDPLADGAVEYPAGFCEGIVEGLLVDSDGHLRLTPDNLRAAIRIAARLDDGVVEGLIKAVEGADLSSELESMPESRGEILHVLRTVSPEASTHVDLAAAIKERIGQLATRGDLYVVPVPDGGWVVRNPRATRASSHHDTQAEAIERARRRVANAGGGEVRIHGRDGKIRDSDTIPARNDFHPPQDPKR